MLYLIRMLLSFQTNVQEQLNEALNSLVEITKKSILKKKSKNN